MNGSNRSPRGKHSKWLLLITIPVQMGAIIFAFAWLGGRLDENYPNKHNIWIKALTLLGVAIAFYNLNRQLKDINKYDNDREDT